MAGHMISSTLLMEVAGYDVCYKSSFPESPKTSGNIERYSVGTVKEGGGMPT